MSTALVLIILAVGFLLGILMIAAGGMSDAPISGDKTAKGGLIIVIICITLFVLALVAKHHGWN